MHGRRALISFFFRFDRPVVWPAAGLKPEHPGPDLVLHVPCRYRILPYSIYGRIYGESSRQGGLTPVYDPV